MKLKPFDLSMADDMSMYDHLPYQRDSDRCNAGALALYSGNVVKYYRCSFGEILDLADMDDLAVKKIQEYLKRERERLAALETSEPEVIDTFAEDEDEDGLSAEQLQSLVGDKPKKKSFLGDYDYEDY